MKLKKIFKNVRKNVFVKDIMPKKVLNLHADDYVFKAIDVMVEKSISTIVTKKDNKPIGILTERDLVKKMLLKNRDPKKTKIKEIMTKKPIEVHPDDTVLRASNIMKKHKVRKLVVVDDNNELVGILSQTDIIESLYEIEDAYKTLIWNPWFSIILIIIVLILFFLNYVLFRR